METVRWGVTVRIQVGTITTKNNNIEVAAKSQDLQEFSIVKSTCLESYFRQNSIRNFMD